MNKVLVYVGRGDESFLLHLAQLSNGFSHIPNKDDVIATQDLERSFVVRHRSFVMSGDIDDDNEAPIAHIHSIFVNEINR